MTSSTVNFRESWQRALQEGSTKWLGNLRQLREGSCTTGHQIYRTTENQNHSYLLCTSITAGGQLLPTFLSCKYSDASLQWDCTPDYVPTYCGEILQSLRPLIAFQHPSRARPRQSTINTTTRMSQNIFEYAVWQRSHWTESGGHSRSCSTLSRIRLRR